MASDAEARELLRKLKELKFGDNLPLRLVEQVEELNRDDPFSDSDENDFPDFSNRPGLGSGSGPPITTKLPPKTVLDLSQPTVNVPEIGEITVPTILSVAASDTAIEHPAGLTQADWLIVARNSRILYAYTMENVSDDGKPPQARKAALDWMVPDSTDFRVPLELEATVQSKVTYTSETASYVRAGFDKQQASAGFPFAAASFEREHKERQAGASYNKQLQMIGRWHYPRVQLNLKDCATASDRFKTAIGNALDAYDTSKDVKPLLTVFKEFGTAVPSEVILGGQLLLVHTEDYNGTVNEREVENVISAAVSIKTTKAEGSVGASFQNAQGNKVSGDSVNKSTTFTVSGGDTTLASNPEQWPNTVKPANSWAVIGRSNLTSIVEWLPQDLRSRVMTLWPKVPIPPAVWDLEDYGSPNGPSFQDHNRKAERDQFVLGARIVPDANEGARGAVQLICGTSMTPALGQGDAAGGAASFHRYREDDIWIDTSSVCLPVPAKHYYAATTPDTWKDRGKAPVRFAVAETNLTLDKWRLIDMTQDRSNYRGFRAQTDGFVFCSVDTRNNGARGYVTCEVDNILIAATSVHTSHPKPPVPDNWIQYASFCAPYAKGSLVKVNVFPTVGELWWSVWQIPSTSQAWKFTKSVPFKLGAYVTAETDGFLNGVVTAPGDGPRGVLRLDCTKDQTDFKLHPLASAAVHVWSYRDRWISHSSAMVPVRKNYRIGASLNITSPAPLAQVCWTGVVPVIEGSLT